MEEYTKRAFTYIKPIEVATGPCKEVVKMGREANLFELPFCYHAIGDGGRYTFHNLTICKDPDTEWINVGQYCCEIYSERRCVVTPYAYTNFVQIYTTKYEARGQSMPVAIALMGDPVYALAATIVPPPGISEFDIAGGLRGAPMELVRCETSDLLVPADAEVVIEGELRPFERLPEGPKIESFGFSVGPRQPLYAIRVNCITHRANPLITVFHMSHWLESSQILVDENLFMGRIPLFKRLGFPSRKGGTEAISRLGNVIVTAIRRSPDPDFFGRIYRQSRAYGAFWVLPYNWFIDEEVPWYKPEEVVEAVFTQADPARDYYRTEPACPTMTISASWMEPEDRAKHFRGGMQKHPHLVVDATTKEEPPLGVRRMWFESAFPEEVQRWVVDNWKRWGFEEEPEWYKGWFDLDVIGMVP